MVKVFTSKSGKRILEEKKSKIEIQKLIKQAKKDIEDKKSKRSKFYALQLAFIEKVKKLCSKSSSKSGAMSSGFRVGTQKVGYGFRPNFICADP